MLVLSRAPSRAPRPQRRRAVSVGSLLRVVLEHGPLPRSTMARLTGLSPASVTGHTAELLALGLLTELPEATATNGMGRPFIPVDLDTSVGLVGGIHYAIPHATVAVLDIRGRVLAERRVPHGDAGPERITERSAETLAQLLAERPHGDRLLGIGIATGGWVDRDHGTIVEHPMLGWRQVPAGAVFARRFGVPALVDSHSRALVRAEQLFGHPRSRESVLAVFIGNVVDAAFALGEQVHHGPRFQAGSIAHMPVAGSTEPCACGRTGCLEATVSERRLVERAHRAGLIAEPSIFELVDVAAAGDPAARALFHRRAEVVGRAIAPIADMLNPDLILLVEPGLARLPDALAALRAEVARHSATVTDPGRTVLMSSFMHAPLAMAGGAVMLDALYTDPFTVPALEKAP
ncbi:ROK family protein [Dactylosporangium sp. NPDC051541]|uniref:ROK family protein n=1 Tax=Dactylosporangium sp. NPDC051541 TaxID=3363977 RepID=UPI0037A2C693